VIGRGGDEGALLPLTADDIKYCNKMKFAFVIPKVEQKEIKKLCKGITQEGNPCKNKEKKNGFCLRHCDITVNINELTVKELKTYAKHIKLTNYSDKKKDELIKMIKYQLKH
jgi:hypothetical protein